MSGKIEAMMQIVRNTENAQTPEAERMNVLARKMLRKHGIFAI